MSISSSAMMTSRPSTSPMRLSADDALLVADPLLVDDGERCIELAREVAGALGAADVRREHSHGGDVAVLEVAAQDVEGRQLVHGDVEEPLDLPGVQVDGEDTVRPGGLDEVGEEPGGDGDSGLVLLVAAAVAVIGEDGRNPAGGRALERVDHDQQFHDAAIDGR